MLLATVAECYVEVLDEVVQMFDQALSGMENRAKRKVKEKLAQRAKNDVNKMDLLEEMLAVTTDTAIPDDQVGGLLRGKIGMDRMRAAAGTQRTGCTGTTDIWTRWRTRSPNCGSSPPK